MKKFLKYAVAAALALGWGASALAADAPVKREMRSAWVATVWRLDWPQNVISSTGNESEIKRQKADMDRLLDSLSTNNMNAINFQIRSRCDAMYRSSFEPWSTDLVATRGMDPGWDPLEYVVEGCHKRGMECHAWVNPYRYESVANQWDGTEGVYRDDHPDWVMDVKGAAILNPGLPEVTQRICDIIKEVITNYDVDGVLFDDYFYLSGTTTEHDGNLYNAYKANGGTMTIGDWRRDNVNRMVAAVYKTIKETKPWVRFGISPAGIACTTSSVAKKYGIDRCPTGSDWQYSDIYSDPIAWISQQNLDFISPQIYWTIGNSTDYNKATKWWSQVAAKFGRHLYVSHSISSLNSSSKAPGRSGHEQVDVPNLFASGPNKDTFEEYANEIRLNREYTQNDAPGSIFYSCKYLYKEAPLFSHYLRNTVFGNKALVPAMTWLKGENPGKVQNLDRAAAELTWTGYDNVRYTVYAVPTAKMANFDCDPEYLVGVTYSPRYTLPNDRLSGYQYAVCVLDRYGNEYSPALLGVADRDLPAPEVLTPKKGETVEAPFYFEWKAVEGATNYLLEIAEDAAMTNWVCSRSTTATTLSSEELTNVPLNKPIYMRLSACGPGYNDGVSPVIEFTINCLEITYPPKGAIDLELSPRFVWSNPQTEGVLQISTSEEFAQAATFTFPAATGAFQVPDYRLSSETHYYSRLLYVHNGVDRATDVVEFTTRPEKDFAAPGIAWPTNGGVLHSDQHIVLAPVAGPSALRLEVSAATSFNSRSSYIVTGISLEDWTDWHLASEIKVNNALLEDGKTYYARARASYRTEDGTKNSDYCPYISFTYSAQTGGVGSVLADPDEATDGDVYNLQGIRVRAEGSAEGLPAGMYIIGGRKVIVK